MNKLSITILSLPFLLTVTSSLVSRRLVTVVRGTVGRVWPLHLPRLIPGQVSTPPRDQLTPPALFRTGVSQHTSTSSVSEQTLTVTGSEVPSFPISTLKELILTLSSEPEDGLELPEGEGSLDGLGLAVGAGPLGIVPVGLGQLRLLLESRLQDRLLTESVAPTL